VAFADRLRAARRALFGPAPAAAPASARGLRASSFDGAATNRLLADWTAPLLSPLQEVGWNLRTLRARSRALVRNNAYAAGFVDEIANQVVGPDGIRYEARVHTATGDLARATNAALEDAWAQWGEPATASVDGVDSWLELQRLVLQTAVVDGECFFRHWRYLDDNRFGYTVQLIDPDLVDESLTQRPANGANEIRMGVELDARGRPVAYHVFTGHPAEGTRERVRIPATEMGHAFVRRRPGQTRGLPWLTPVLVEFKMLDGYEEAELVAARVSAAKMGFIVNKSPEAMAAADPDAEAIAPVSMDASPGIITELDPGKEFVGFDPTHPSTAYKEFTGSILRGIARAVSMSYASFTGDLNGTSYSSIRAGILPERDHFRWVQTWLATRFHTPVHAAWLPQALLAGAVRVDTRLAADYAARRWRPRGWKWVDPLKDMQGAQLAIALGLDSRTRLSAEQGREFEDVVDELAEEIAYAAEQGVPIDGPAAGSGGAPASDGADGGDGGDATGGAPAGQPAASTPALHVA
jgi:lambda family phage portal protein